jgi:hypothetical protein
MHQEWRRILDEGLFAGFEGVEFGHWGEGLVQRNIGGELVLEVSNAVDLLLYLFLFEWVFLLVDLEVCFMQTLCLFLQSDDPFPFRVEYEIGLLYLIIDDHKFTVFFI